MKDERYLKSRDLYEGGSRRLQSWLDGDGERDSWAVSLGSGLGNKQVDVQMKGLERNGGVSYVYSITEGIVMKNSPRKSMRIL